MALIIRTLVSIGVCWCAAALAPVSAQDFDQGREVTGERAVLEFRDRIAPENEMTRDRLKPILICGW